LKKFVEDTVKRFEAKHIEGVKGSRLVAFTKETFTFWNDVCEKNKKGSSEWNKVMTDLNKTLGNAIKAGNEKMVKELEKRIADAQGKSDDWFKDKNTVTREINVNVNDKNFSEDDIDQLKEIVRKKAEEAHKSEKNKGFSMGAVTDVEQTRPNGDNKDKYDRNEAMRKGKAINKKLREKIKLQEDLERRHRNGQTIDFQEVSRQMGQAGRIFKTNVFQRNNTFGKGGEWAIEVMCDCSGSMGGKDMSQAKQALATLAYALNGLPNVHYALTGFDFDYGAYREYQIKRFNEKRLKPEYLDKVEAKCGTPIETAVRFSAERLNKFKNIRKLMVVITDGSGHKGDTIENVKRAEGMHISVIGIGIGSDSVKETFKDHYIYEDTNNLDKDLTRIILEGLEQKKKARLVKGSWEI